MAKEEAVGVIINGVERDFFNRFQELPFVAGASPQHLPKLPAAGE
jgi:hypothetical protein